VPQETTQHVCGLGICAGIQRDGVDIPGRIVAARNSAGEIDPLAQPVGKGELLLVVQVYLREDQHAAIFQRLAERLHDVVLQQVLFRDVHNAANVPFHLINGESHGLLHKHSSLEPDQVSRCTNEGNR
jgi:hypothetical protein